MSSCLKIQIRGGYFPTLEVWPRSGFAFFKSSKKVSHRFILHFWIEVHSRDSQTDDQEELSHPSFYLNELFDPKRGNKVRWYISVHFSSTHGTYFTRVNREGTSAFVTPHTIFLIACLSCKMTPKMLSPLQRCHVCDVNATAAFLDAHARWDASIKSVSSSLDSVTVSQLNLFSLS